MALPGQFPDLPSLHGKIRLINRLFAPHMDIHSIVLHPEFPQKTWVVVEQPRDEPYRLVYDPQSQRFQRSEHRSLLYARGFSGVYGWIGGSGTPPEAHHDVILLTGQFLPAGAIVQGHVCGVFLRQDNDHKFIAVDDERRQNMPCADLACLDELSRQDLLRLYPRIGEGEGWFGAEIAFAHLLKKPLHD
jgi:inorganic pyrophosphatase